MLPTSLLLPVAFLVVLPGPGVATTPGPAIAPDTAVLSVRGHAEVSAPPDRARVRFAVETRAPGASEAVEANAARMERVVDALREAGVGRGATETTGFSLRPEYGRTGPRGEGGRELIAYRAANGIDVTTDDLDGIGALIDAAVEAGADRVSGLRFEAADPDSLRREALRHAVTSAREEAESVASAVGRELGAIVEVEIEGEGGGPGPVAYREVAVASARVETPVEPGEITVSAAVRLRYLLRAP